LKGAYLPLGLGDAIEVYSIWGGPRRIVAGVDTVVISMMRIPNDALFNEIRESFKEVRCVGDVVAPRKPAAVIYEGEKVGREI
jgi:hypothetical protein